MVEYKEKEEEGEKGKREEEERKKKKKKYKKKGGERKRLGCWRMRPIDGPKERADHQSVIWYWPHLVVLWLLRLFI